MERSTRGTSVITPFKLVTGSNLADVGRVRCFPAGWVYRRESPGRVYLLAREAMGKVCGVLVAMPLGQGPGSSFGKRTAVNTGSTLSRFPAARGQHGCRDRRTGR
jgi:hypothetical protein